MTLRDDYVRILEAENDELRERVRQLEHLLGFTFDAPPQIALSAQEARLFGALMARELVTKEIGLQACVKPGRIEDEPALKIVDVIVCKLRRKLEPYGIAIETRWGVGYFLTPEARAAADELLRQARRRVAPNSALAQATARDSASLSPSVHPTIAAHAPAQCAEQTTKD